MKDLKSKLIEKLEELFNLTTAKNVSYETWKEANETLEEVEEVYSFNEFQYEYRGGEDVLEPMENLSEMGGDWDDPQFVLCRAFYGYKFNPFAEDKREEFCPVDEYYFLNGYGNLVSVEEADKYRFWAQYMDEDEYVEAVEEQGKLEELARALEVEYEEDEEEDEEDE